MVEQRPFKPKVVGSIPTAPTNHPFSQQQLSDLSGRQKAALKNKTSFEGGTASSREKRETQFRTLLNSGCCRDSVAWIGFTTTYNNAGTAKIPVSRTRHHLLWVGNFGIATKRAEPLPSPGSGDFMSISYQTGGLCRSS